MRSINAACDCDMNLPSRNNNFYRSEHSCFGSGAPFWDVFWISVALSLRVVLQLSNITPGESKAKAVGRNTKRK